MDYKSNRTLRLENLELENYILEKRSSGLISSETNALLTGIANEARNFQTQDHLNTRDRLLYLNELLSLMKAAIDGKDIGNQYSVQTADSVFGNYKSEENAANANLTILRAKQNVHPVGYRNTSNTQASFKPASIEHYNYSWDKGFGEEWGDLNPTLKSKMSALIEHFRGNISDLMNASLSGKVIHGTSLSLDKYNELLNSLNNLSTKIKDGDDLLNFKDLGSIASKLGMTAKLAKDYFGETLPGFTLNDEKTPEDLKKDGYKYLDIDESSFNNYVKNYLKKHNYQLYLKGDSYRVRDKEGRITNPFSDVNTDNFSPTDFDTFVYSDVDGNFYTGLGSDILNDTSSILYDPYNKILAQKQSDYDSNYGSYSYNPTEEMALEDVIERTMDLLRKDDYLSPFNYTDVSGYFGGKQAVIAVKNNGVDKLSKNKFNNLIFDDSVRFYTVDKSSDRLVEAKVENGQIVPTSTIDTGFFTGERVFNLNGTSIRTFSPLKKNKRIFAQAPLTENPMFHKDTSIYGRGFWGETLVNLGDYTEAGDNVLNFINLMLNAINSSNREDAAFNPGENDDTLQLVLENHFYFSDPVKFYNHFVYYVNQHKDQLTTPLLKKYKQALKKMNEEMGLDNKKATQSIVSQKNGGIIKAFEGTSLDINGNEYTEMTPAQQQALLYRVDMQKARSEGYDSVSQYHSNEKPFEWDGADSWRMGTLALDLISAATAFVPAYGTAASAIAGTGALVTDLVADIMDEGVSSGELFKNIGYNLGFTALGLIPGGKLPKIFKSVIKFTPQIIGTLSAIGAAPELISVIKKANDPHASFTEEDWRDLLEVGKALLLVTSSTTHGIKNAKANRKIKDLTEGNGVTTKQVFKGVKNKEGQPIEVDDKTKDAVQKHLDAGTAKGKEKAINELMKLKGVDRNTAKEIIRYDGHFYDPRVWFGKYKPKMRKTVEEKDISQSAVTLIYKDLGKDKNGKIKDHATSLLLAMMRVYPEFDNSRFYLMSPKKNENLHTKLTK